MTVAPAQQALYDCRDAFAATVEALAEEDERVVVVCNDSVGSSKLGGFQQRFPTRLVNVGIETTRAAMSSAASSAAASSARETIVPFAITVTSLPSASRVALPSSKW